jgi:serine/threonine-protein kinase
MVAEPSPIAAGQGVGGKYRLERQLSSGGMGSLWVAVHESLDVRVAVKFMHPFAASAVGRARFEREAKASALVRSPHVVQVLDYGTAEGVPFLAMELLEGEDLATRLERRGRLPVGVVATITQQVCKALRVAHEAGVVHRDLKPANLFLCRVKDEEVVKLLDFGLAKSRSLGKPVLDDLTTGDTVLGSPRYMSPEQVRGTRDVDHRSDLWSLGVILFRALSARVPFAGTMVGDLIVKICSDPLPVISELAPDLGPDFDAFFLRVFAREPGARFQSARELADAFAEIAARHGWTPGEALRPDEDAVPGVIELPDWEVMSEASVAVPSAPAPVVVAPASPAAAAEPVPAPAAAARGRFVAIAAGSAAVLVAALVVATRSSSSSEAAPTSSAPRAPSSAAPIASASAMPVLAVSDLPSLPIAASSADPTSTARAPSAPSARPQASTSKAGHREPSATSAPSPAPAPAPAPAPSPAPDRTSAVLGF